MKKVIIADDDFLVRDFLGRAISRVCGELKIPVEVGAVTSGKELRQKVLEGTDIYDLVVSDADMEEVGIGLEILKEVRKWDPQVPYIVISGRSLEIEAKEAGATAFYQKPFGVNTIEEMMKTYLMAA